jgi:hypothetical protein
MSHRVLAFALIVFNTVSIAAAGDPLQTRVTVSFTNAAAADVVNALAAGAGVTAEIATGPMRPVTMTLTNVKLRTALDAICDNALCSWRFTGSLHVTPLPSEASALLPASVSLELFDVPPVEVFRAVATAIGASIVIEPGLPSEPVSFNFRNAPTAEVLNALCQAMRCAWDFDSVRGLRVMAKR